MNLQPLNLVNAQMPGAPRFWREDLPPSQNPHEYRRVVGGICWPNPLTQGQGGVGSWCILGEERIPDSLTLRHSVRVLAAGQNDSVAMLLDGATAAASVVQCGYWTAPLNEPGFRLSLEWQKNRRVLAQPVIKMAHPPSTRFGVLWELLKARTKGEKSFLFGDHGEAIAQAIKGLDAEAVKQNINTYPAVAAVLYALGAIDLLSAPKAKTRKWKPGKAGY